MLVRSNRCRVRRGRRSVLYTVCVCLSRLTTAACPATLIPAFLYTDDITSHKPEMHDKALARWDDKTLGKKAAKVDFGNRKNFVEQSRAGHGDFIAWSGTPHSTRSAAEVPSLQDMARGRAQNAHMFRENRF